MDDKNNLYEIVRVEIVCNVSVIDFDSLLLVFLRNELVYCQQEK